MSDHPSPAFEDLLYSVEDGTARITLNRPDALNAFTSSLYGELRDAVRSADADDRVDTIVLTGTGRAFGTGGDLAEGLEVLAPDADPLAVYRFADNLPYDAIRTTSKVVIAGVNGLCMAGGLIAALSCDIIVASDEAIFGIPEGRVGMPEPWVPNLLFARMSLAQIKYLTLTGGTITATEAFEFGLVPLVVPHAQLDEQVGLVVERVRETTVEARAGYKDYINRLIPYTPPIEAVRVMQTPGALDRLQAFSQRNGSSPDPAPEKVTPTDSAVET